MGPEKHTFIEHNPLNCVLTKQMVDSLDYKKDLIAMLKWRQTRPMDYGSAASLQSRFVSECEKVETLVLDPLPDELKQIFYERSASKNPVICFEITTKIFPNLTDLFL